MILWEQIQYPWKSQQKYTAMPNIFMSETNFELYKNAGLLIKLKKYTLNS